MPSTRSATGNSKPRIFDKAEATVKAVTGQKGAGRPKKATANTSKPRSTKVSTDKVTKKAAPKKKAAATTKKAPAKKPAAKKSTAAKVDHKLAAEAAKHETKETEAEAKPHHEPTLVDTITGAALKVQGLLTGSSGKKAAGTAKMRGTDGKKPSKK